MTSLYENKINNGILLKKFEYTFLLSAVGDSLGWPQEFIRRKINNNNNELKYYKNWTKLVGGKWWGYLDNIKSGEYSDDSQLTLAIARSINLTGNFDPEYFAYLELPLWLNYERGGGRSIKTAARNILKKSVEWTCNFYRTKYVDYRNAGANGVAMRNLPIAILNFDNEDKFIIDTFKNAVITHGHPRAILGALLIGASQIYFLKADEYKFEDLYLFISKILKKSLQIALTDNSIKKWYDLRIMEPKRITKWLNNNSINKNGVKNENDLNNKTNFENLYGDIIIEALKYIKNIPNYLSKKDEAYYNYVNAFDPNFKGSGISTTSIAIYLFTKYIDNPEKALLTAANMIGSDTDTIASLVGSLIGVYHYNKINSKILSKLINDVQDKNYFKNIAEYLWKIKNKSFNFIEISKPLDKIDALLRITSWEFDLHNLFWEILDEGDKIIHPTLGKGEIINKRINKIRMRSDYVAKIFKVRFNSGQTVYFHSRVSKKGLVHESLYKYFAKSLISIFI
ncbi:MAG: ADP-ribosylglycohydrolase family protein [Candidatus Helarchaeota archaeon]